MKRLLLVLLSLTLVSCNEAQLGKLIEHDAGEEASSYLNLADPELVSLTASHNELGEEKSKSYRLEIYNLNSLDVSNNNSNALLARLENCQRPKAVFKKPISRLAILKLHGVDCSNLYQDYLSNDLSYKELVKYYYMCKTQIERTPVGVVFNYHESDDERFAHVFDMRKFLESIEDLPENAVFQTVLNFSVARKAFYDDYRYVNQELRENVSVELQFNALVDHNENQCEGVTE